MAASTIVSLAPNTWVEIAADAEDFDVYNAFEEPIEWAMGATAPTANTSYPEVLSGERLVRGDLTDKVFMRHSMGRTVQIPIIK